MQNNMNMKLNHYMGVIACISLLLLGSCNSGYSESRNFDDIIFQIENDPQSYLLRLDTINMNCVKNKRDAVHFILAAITLSYTDNNYYPPKSVLERCIQIFKKEKMIQPYLETLYLLAKTYKKENDITKEVHTIETAINIARQEYDQEWLFYLYSYLGEMYIRQFNTLNFIKYQTLANQCIKDVYFQDMSISTQIQVAKSFLYLNRYKVSYEKLNEIEKHLGKKNIFLSEIKRLQGIALYKMQHWDACIEKLKESVVEETSIEHKFTCFAILTYCYYRKKDLLNAEKYKYLAIENSINGGNVFAEIEFYTLCAEFAQLNRDAGEQIKCFNKLKEKYEMAFDCLNGESLDKAIQAYTNICEKQSIYRQIAIYKYILIGLLLVLCVSLVIYIQLRRRQVYKILALQQQINSLDNLRNVKNEVKEFILRDFEIAKKIAILRSTQQVQSARFLKDLEKYHIIDENYLLGTQWEQFYNHIDLSFDGFYSKLIQKYPMLNDKEVQLCCMLVSGFKTEEIAAIWMNSVFSVHKYKTNIRKKIGIPEGGDIILFLVEKLDL